MNPQLSPLRPVKRVYPNISQRMSKRIIRGNGLSEIIPKYEWNGIADGFAVLQSQRDCATKPRVARNELPWVWARMACNPNGVVAARNCRCTEPQPCQGC